MLTADFSGRKPRRQRSAGHDVFGLNDVGGIIEISKISGPYVDRTNAEPDLFLVDKIEIDKTFKRSLQIACVVEACNRNTSIVIEKTNRRAWRKKTDGPVHQRKSCTELIEQPTCKIASRRQIFR